MMGFCSGTDIFDPVVDVLLEASDADISPVGKHEILVALINALEYHDWDCQDESKYSKHPSVRKAMREIHPDWDWLNVDQ